jgi:O-antigen/teichoic acid export membrane protein
VREDSELEEEKRVVASNSLYHFFRFISKNFIAFIVSIFLVRFLGATNYGVFTVATIYWGLFLMLFTFGWANAVQYGIAKYRANNKFGFLDWLVKHYLKILTLSSIAGSIVMFLLAGPIASAYRSPQLGSLIEILAVGLVFYALVESFTTNVFIGYQKMKYTFLMGVTFDALRLLQGVLVIIGFGLLGVIAFYDVIYVIITVLALYFIYKLLRLHKVKKELPAPEKDLKEFRKYNVFSYVSNLISYFYGSAISLFLGIFAPSLASVSFYTVGLQLATLISMPATSLTAAFFATNTKYFEKRQYTELYRFLKVLLRYIAMVTIPLAVGGIAAAGPLITYFYRSALSNSTIPFIIIIISMLMTAMFLPLTSFVSAIGKQKYFMYSSIAGAVVAILATVILMPPFLQNGAALAFFLSSLAILVTSLYFASKYIKIILPYSDIAKVTIASLLMGLFIYFTDRAIPLAFLPWVLIVGVIIYIFIIYIMEVLTKEDISFFLKLTKLDKFFAKITNR